MLRADTPTEYLPSEIAPSHPERARAILAAHPEVRQLFGTTPWTALLTAAVVIFQTVMAAVMGRLGFDSWWLSLIAAYGIGAFADHAMYVVIHDACHNTIFRIGALNRLTAILADLPNVFPSAISFGIYHRRHHSHLSQYADDADMAHDWEARLVGNRWYRKALWLMLFPLFQGIHIQRIRAVTPVTGWAVLNFIVVVGFDILIWRYFGWNAILYLMASFLFALGLHPLGARWISEHYTNDPRQETCSYYGILNLVSLNIGYHNEHHDLPAVPWNRLPALRRMAPEFYAPLQVQKSWTRLLFRFIFDPNYTLYSRIVRPSSGGAA